MIRQATQAEKMISLLRGDVFDGVDRQEVARISELVRSVSIDNGTVLVTPGQRKQEIITIYKGKAIVETTSGKAELHAPFSVGAHSVLGACDEPWAIIAGEDLQGDVVDRHSVLEVLDESNHVYLNLLQRTAKSLVGLSQRMVEEGLSFEVQYKPSEKCSGHSLDLVERMYLIRHSFQFQTTQLEAIASLAQEFEEVSLRKGDSLWKQGAVEDDLYIVVSGNIRCVAGEQEFIVHPGEYLGAIEALAQVARWHTAVAEEPSIVLHGNIQHFIDLLEDYHDMALSMLRIMRQTLIEFVDIILKTGDLSVVALAYEFDVNHKL